MAGVGIDVWDVLIFDGAKLLKDANEKPTFRGEWVLAAVLDWLRSYRQQAHPRIQAIQQQELQQVVRAGM
jgi:hypothetical protein